MAETFIDLFAGIGGFHQAAAELGLSCVFSSEKDPQARLTYLANHKTPIMNEDITKIRPRDVPDHNYLFAGFPCQPFSQAGHKKGFNDERGNLFFAIHKILKAKQPKGIFLENVRHLLKHDNGETLNTIKLLLMEAGYNPAVKVVFAKDFGVPQLRPRVFILATLDGEPPEWPAEQPLTLTLDQVLGGKCTRKLAYTIRVGGRGSPLKGRHNWDGYNVDGEDVRLTIEQCAALQGFPSEFKFPASKTATFKQLGNSVAVPAVKAHIEALIKACSQ